VAFLTGGMMRYKLLIALVGLFLFCGGACAQETKQDGWWIKVNAPKKEAPDLVFYVGASARSYGFWRVWNPGDPLEFDIPDEYRNAPKLYIKAQTTSGRMSRICVMFKSKGVKHFEYDIEEDHEMNPSEEDKVCQ
jgi:hypothetical protein